MDYGLLMIDCCVQTPAAHVGALKMTPPEHPVSDSRLPTADPLILTTYNSLIMPNKANSS
jgi:hypothetical protein